MEWSDSQGLDSKGLGASGKLPEMVGGGGSIYGVDALPQWLQEARTVALSKQNEKDKQNSTSRRY